MWAHPVYRKPAFVYSYMEHHNLPRLSAEEEEMTSLAVIQWQDSSQRDLMTQREFDQANLLYFWPIGVAVLWCLWHLRKPGGRA